ncbi:MAG: aspartate carbamoyltransferase, partial [Candidatus Dadabacteria bacterium]
MSERKHLLGIEGLGKDEILSILESARGFLEISEREIKKTPALRGKTVINLFFEPSTRTRTSFEIAAKRLSADTVNISSSTSSTTKGETLIDTVKTLQSMKPDVLVIRHSQEGAPVLAARHLADTSVINAGDGMHEHPTQALLDCLSLSLYY